MIIDEQLLKDLLVKAKESPRLRMSYDLRTTPEDQSQRILNALIPGTVLPIHCHRMSAETVVLLRGNMDEIIYDSEGREIERFHLNQNEGCFGAQILKGTWHSVEVHEPSVIVEMKDGAYQPLVSDDILIIE